MKNYKENYVNFLTDKIEHLLCISMMRPLISIENTPNSFFIYRPVNKKELEQDNLPIHITKALDAVLDTMIENREAYFAQFKNDSDLNLLKELGYNKPKSVTFLILKRDYDELTTENKSRFIIQQQLNADIYKLN